MLAPRLVFLFVACACVCVLRSQMLEYRSQFGRREGRREDVGVVEGRVLECFVALTLQLSESQLKPVFLQLLHWGACAPAEIAAAASLAPGPGEDGPRFFRFAHLCRRITTFRCLEALQDALKSIFTPYCASFLQVLARACTHALGEGGRMWAWGGCGKGSGERRCNATLESSFVRGRVCALVLGG
jgi:hypothetical protein